MLNQSFIDEINRIFAPLMPRMPNFRYWRPPNKREREKIGKNKYIFGWTTERDRHGKFYAFKYRELANGNWRLKKKVAFGKRRVAKARSSKWHDQYYNIN